MDLYEKIDKVNELVGIDAKLSYLDILINKETNNFHENYMHKVMSLHIEKMHESEIQDLLDDRNIKLDNNMFKENTLILLLQEVEFSTDKLMHSNYVMSTNYGIDWNRIPQSVEKSDVFLTYIEWSKIAKAPYPFIKTVLGFDLYNKYKEKPDEFKYLGRINNILQRYDDASYMAYTHVCNTEFTYNEFLNISYGDKVFKFHNNIDNILDKVKDMQEELKKLSYPEYFESLENIFIESICKDKDLENTIEMDNDIEERDI